MFKNKTILVTGSAAFMKVCAARGYGLGHCTAFYFKDHNGFNKIR